MQDHTLSKDDVIFFLYTINPPNLHHTVFVIGILHIQRRRNEDRIGYILNAFISAASSNSPRIST
ncbi:hypothetical protein SSYM_2440 [Serratia symbiotica str. Tucson]|uniref:Uncharacterized protein n=1 Tax=Serratia symbiotica str. Tucson TaxID=914128 RepID=E9CPI7_9GAMM|nr:hypothetical protein SSYM_2440 [Serratia symbiotica str. Tucson]